MAANKIILNGETLIDLTQDTAIEADVAEGKTFHKANGEQAVGTATVGAVSTARTEFLERMAAGVPPALITAEMLEGVDHISNTMTTTEHPRYIPSMEFDPNFGDNTYVNELTHRIVIPDTVEKIRSHAFYGCFNLEEVVLPKNLKEIYTGAFAECEYFHALSLPDGLTAIGHGAFYGTSLVDIVVPESVTFLGESSLGCPYLEVLYLPKSALVQAFNSNSMSGCSENAMMYTDASEDFCGENGVTVIPPMVLNSELLVYDGKFQYIKTPDNKALIMKYVADKVTGTVDIPTTIGDCEVTYLSDNMFIGCDFEEGWIVNVNNDLYWSHHDWESYYALGLPWANAKGTCNFVSQGDTTTRIFPSSFITEDGQWFCFRNLSGEEGSDGNVYSVIYNGVSLSGTIDVPPPDQFSDMSPEDGYYRLYDGKWIGNTFIYTYPPAFYGCLIEDDFVIRLPSTKDKYGYEEYTNDHHGAHYYGIPLEYERSTGRITKGRVEHANGWTIKFPWEVE